MDAPADSNEHSELSPEFAPARFPQQLGLPPAEHDLLTAAARAVRDECRDGSRWKRLHCQKVSVFAERDRAAVYAIHVDGFIEFDWTWEGATAFCLREMDNPHLNSSSGNVASNSALEKIDTRDDLLWSAEILQVDEQQGCLFVGLDDPQRTPAAGAFYVRPFDFMRTLNAIFNESHFESTRPALPSRLAAALGNVHPKVVANNDAGLPQLNAWWQHAWSILWGPPGTGKTYTTGQQVARVLADPAERILVVSTTNRATDEVALSVGKAATEYGAWNDDSNASDRLLRIGKGAAFGRFAEQGLESMLLGTESESLLRIGELTEQLRTLESGEEKAFARQQIADLRASTRDQSRHILVNPDVKVVIATAFKAISMLDHETVRSMIESNEAPFTTVFVDEAGLISRAAVAALSLLAARRVVLVGDSKQLAPISRISRAQAKREVIWLASSGLSHLDASENIPDAVHLLNEQRRMHPDICRIVSQFQYHGRLTTAPEISNRPALLPASLAESQLPCSRAIWYVLDQEPLDLAAIRATSGPGNRSWVRTATFSVLEKIFAQPCMRESQGLFISPFKAQAQAIARLFTQWKLDGWEASTVHSQQGYERDVVIFDTVNAGSTSWPPEEWKRLVNVAISRAREAVIVIASESEMQEPFLRPLLPFLTPAVLKPGKLGGTEQWTEVDEDYVRSNKHSYTLSRAATPSDDPSLGGQFRRRKQLSPILSQEQQRLASLNLDGRPRLVRGVAGSGKSLVLSNWLARTVQRLHDNDSSHRIWAVYANRSLHKLLRETIEAAWADLQPPLLRDVEFPWGQVELMHILDVLKKLLPSVQLSMNTFEFDYDRAAAEFLSREVDNDSLPSCRALFIDEAQDMGPSTLKLLLSLVEQSDAEDANSRSAHIFYDNAQNIYDRRTPRWSEFGLDMRGRSTVMKESYRSTTPITELAVNLSYRLADRKLSDDQKELIALELLQESTSGDQPWLQVCFNRVDGPPPVFQIHDTIDAEVTAIAQHLRYLIQQEHVPPNDICIIYNGSGSRSLLENKLAPLLKTIGVELSIQKQQSFERRANTLIATTAHSFKGYEAEVVIIPFVDRFVTADSRILSSSLYVAMTRARSILALYSTRSTNPASDRLNRELQSCVECLGRT